ncbi:hypothetical protein SAMN05216464_11153 [Mucilaginibacter pineti]|uniref:HTH cro/C1-type domain-containing protein n=1 Tax=Mucilaginibacter pineti TaxID=1391627 RepID=A0A1G7H4L9_9SPHI|nr:hypothetical protein SAMN05216464_11153 [Mucilaginibacter pineti]
MLHYETATSSFTKAQKLLNGLGENIKLARLLRKLNTTKISERTVISRATLWQIEKGHAYCSHGSLFPAVICYGTGKRFPETGVR